MMYSLRSWLVAVALVRIVSSEPTGCARAEDPVPNSGTQAAAQPTAELPAQSTRPSPPPLSEQPPAYVLPPVGWPTVDSSRPDPLLDRPYSAQPGVYTNVEVNVLWLRLRNQLGGPVINPVTGNTDFVRFAGNKLDPTTSPRLEVGYRFADNWGSVSLGYAGLASRGHDQLTTGPEDVIQALADQVGRLDYNLFDLTYNSREYCLDPHWNMRWGVGARMMFLFFDSRLRFLNPGSDPGDLMAQTESNFITCYGFWAYLDLERQIDPSGLSVFGRIEGSDFYGRSRQTYVETVTGNPGDGPQTNTSVFTGAVGPSILRGVIGLTYTVPRWNYSRFMLGGEYETFFQIGRQSPTSGVIDTRGQLDAYGLFLRAEINF
jgi:hypothetical protein